VIDHEIHDGFDAAAVRFGEHLLPVRQSAELLHDILVVADLIPVVVVGRLKDGDSQDADT
jgi:hypothetical protein